MTIQGLIRKTLDTHDDVTLTSTSDLFGKGSLFRNSSTGAILMWVKNGDASATAIGDAMVQDAAASNGEVEFSAATADLPLVGFMAAVVAASSYGFMTVYGPGYGLVDGDTVDVAVGDPLSASGAKTVVKSVTAPRAIALEANTDVAAVKAIFVKCLGH
jgi:hypothetical protein